MKQHHRDFGQLAEQPTKSLHCEYDRPFCKSDMGLTIHTSDNTKRRHSRAKENAKFGLNALLMLTIACFAAGAWIATWFFFPAVTLACFYVLCYFIVDSKSPSKL